MAGIEDKMKSDSFDKLGQCVDNSPNYSYSNTGGLMNKVTSTSDYKQVEKIEVLIKALGTMVLMPEYEVDPLNITATKQFKGNVQMPILMDGHREQTVGKLIELISKL